MNRIVALILGLLSAAAASAPETAAETVLGAGAIVGYYSTEEPALVPEFWVSGGYSSLFSIDAVSDSYIEFFVQAVGAPADNLLELSGSLTADYGREIGEALIRPRLTAYAEWETGSDPSLFGNLGVYMTRGGLESSFSAEPSAAVALEDTRSVTFGMTVLGSWLLGSSSTFTLQASGNYTPPWDFSGWSLSPEAGFTWYGSSLVTVEAKVSYTRSRYDLNETVVQDIAVPSRSFDETGIALSLLVPISSSARFSLDLPVSWAYKVHGAVVDDQLTTDNEWVLSASPAAEFGIGIGRGGLCTVALEGLFIESNSGYQKDVEISMDIGFEYSF